MAMTLAESNLARLAKTDFPKMFVQNHNGEWNHQDWLEFIAFLEKNNYAPIDLDQVGLLLEQQKAEYFKYSH